MKKLFRRRNPAKVQTSRLQLTPEIQALYFQCRLGRSLQLTPADTALIVRLLDRLFPELPEAAREAQRRRRDWRQILRWSLRIAAIVLLLFLIMTFSGCDNRNEFSFALGHRPQQNVLRVSTGNGKSYTLLLNQEIPAQQLIALQTALANTQILEAEMIRRDAQLARHEANLDVFYALLLLVAFLGLVAGAAYVLGCYARRS